VRCQLTSAIVLLLVDTHHYLQRVGTSQWARIVRASSSSRSKAVFESHLKLEYTFSAG
jgi:hypothetical protein